MSAHGRFTWYDLMTTDPEAAKAFYTELIGWGIETWDGPTHYSMWSNEGTPLGGVTELSEEAKPAGAPPHWLAYVAVDDVDATVARATELGGQVLGEPQDIPDSGRFAVLCDPQGAVFAVYHSAKPEVGDDEPPGVGSMSWHELIASDYEAVFEFYAELFGWVKSEVVDMGDGLGMYQLFARREGTAPIGGTFNKLEGMAVAWVVYVRVADVSVAVERLKELGGQLLDGPREIPGGGSIAFCSDPQGACFSLHSEPS